MDVTMLLSLATACAPQIDPGTTLALVRVESSGHPWAIGVVGGRLERQPRSRGEALATALALKAQGRNFSLGLAQINVHNLDGLGLTLDAALEPCKNLAAMQRVLVTCFERAARQRAGNVQRTLQMALSCYYSGDFTRGSRDGYVQRVVAAAVRAATPIPRGFKETS